MNFIICCLFCLLKLSLGALDPIVEIENGKIRGKQHSNYFSFESIPYAEPPVGENRFEPPKHLQEKWTDIRNCTKLPTVCLQWSHFIMKEDRLDGSEDCLYLNVHTPKLHTEELLPVIIFIHGGAFMYGSGNIFRPDLLLKDEDAIVVTIAYRLGPLGFLSTADDEIPGNMGLKDQRMALEWIKNNIQAFGGNPEQILITGFSAGGASVHLHLLSNGIENLISSAVSFSGTAFCPWVMVPDPKERAKKLGSYLDCPMENSRDFKNCMKEKDGADIVRGVKHFIKFQYNPFRIFGPVIEPTSIDNSFLSEDPEKIIKQGKNGKIPWIVSYTADDGGYNGAELMKKSKDGKEFIEEFWDNFNDYAPSALFYGESMSSVEQLKYSNYLKEKYNISNDSNNLDKFFKIQQIFTDELFAQCSWKAIKLHKDFGKSPVYSYFYNNPPVFGIGNILANREDIDFGCVHGDDVFLMFNVPHRDEGFPFREDEKQISEKMVKMLKTFARTGVAKYDELNLLENKAEMEKIMFLKITKEKAEIVEEDKL